MGKATENLLRNALELECEKRNRIKTCLWYYTLPNSQITHEERRQHSWVDSSKRSLGRGEYASKASLPTP